MTMKKLLLILGALGAAFGALNTVLSQAAAAHIIVPAWVGLVIAGAGLVIGVVSRFLADEEAVGQSTAAPPAPPSVGKTLPILLLFGFLGGTAHAGGIPPVYCHTPGGARWEPGQVAPTCCGQAQGGKPFTSETAIQACGAIGCLSKC